MAPSKILSDSDLHRLRACAQDNNTLADCWGQEHIGIVCMEWAPLGCRYEYRSHVSCNEVRGRWRVEHQCPVLSVEVIADRGATTTATATETETTTETTAETTTATATAKSNSKTTPTSYRFWIQRHRTGPWQSPSKQNAQGSFPETTLDCAGPEATARLEKLFSQLQQRFSTICVCSHRPAQTRQGLRQLGFAFPAKRVLQVDLVKVLEYQAKAKAPCSSSGTVPASLRDYVDTRIDVEDRLGGCRFEERLEVADEFDGCYQSHLMEGAPKWGRDGEWYESVRRPRDVAASRVLGVVGPRAEAHRRDLDRMEREDTALRRLSKRLSKDERKEANRVAKKEAQKRASKDKGK